MFLSISQTVSNVDRVCGRGCLSGLSGVVDDSVRYGTVVLVQVCGAGGLDYSVTNVTLTKCGHNGRVGIWTCGLLTTGVIGVCYKGACSWQVEVGWASFITSIQSSAGVLALTSVFTFIIPNLILDVHHSLVQTTLE